MNKIIELVAAATLLVLLPAGCEVDTSGTEVSAAATSEVVPSAPAAAAPVAASPSCAFPTEILSAQATIIAATAKVASPECQQRAYEMGESGGLAAVEHGMVAGAQLLEWHVAYYDGSCRGPAWGRASVADDCGVVVTLLWQQTGLPN
jgi:hypothetical protein